MAPAIVKRCLLERTKFGQTETTLKLSDELSVCSQAANRNCSDGAKSTGSA
ncbi:hypothetical protein PR003_g32333 [Phytophthora rubi]|uniref:Uncharacterized protein n=1 Tax=Phytophthora rubi TaxID=129364 RepID=A0A6A3GHF4_9STRA|nr:hypothetical protein PR001_g31224 [Phytophthora rubi]KAE9265832.1 hypothetical protein PR003_g32333 [Phytophthora rubi]